MRIDCGCGFNGTNQTALIYVLTSRKAFTELAISSDVDRSCTSLSFRWQTQNLDFQGAAGRPITVGFLGMVVEPPLFLSSVVLATNLIKNNSKHQ